MKYRVERDLNPTSVWCLMGESYVQCRDGEMGWLYSQIFEPGYISQPILYRWATNLNPRRKDRWHSMSITPSFRRRGSSAKDDNADCSSPWGPISRNTKNGNIHSMWLISVQPIYFSPSLMSLLARDSVEIQALSSSASKTTPTSSARRSTTEGGDIPSSRSPSSGIFSSSYVPPSKKSNVKMEVRLEMWDLKTFFSMLKVKQRWVALSAGREKAQTLAKLSTVSPLTSHPRIWNAWRWEPSKIVIVTKVRSFR